MKGPSTTKGFIIGAFALVAIAFLFSQVQASSELEIQKEEIIYSNVVNGTVSDVVVSKFPFQMIGLAWQGNSMSEVAVRYYNVNGWSDWYSVDETVEVNGWNFVREPIISNSATKFQYSVISGDISNLKLIYLGESDKLVFNRWNPINLFRKASAENNINIIARSGWKADEDLRFDGANDEIWPTEYQTPEKFVIHHTAGGDGGNDPEGTIRGIYYWHSSVLGWGDIGYNYLIDQDGNIYEGRFGGDGVIGAHVYRNKTCAISRFGGAEFEANFNKGTIGISVLGDYEDIEINNAVKNAIISLIANKAQEFAIEPSGEGYLFDAVYPNIVGHKDLDCTLCPGANLYQELNSIRTESQNLYEDMGGAIDPLVSAIFIQQSAKSISINAGQEKEVWVEFKNTGNITWRTYGQYSPQISSSNESSVILASDMRSQTNIVVSDSSNIAPGETVRFTFSIIAPTDQLEISEDFMLVINESSVSGTKFTLNLQIAGLSYAAKLASDTIAPAMFAGDHQIATFQFRNLGTTAWQNDEVYLNIYDLGDNVSRLYHNNWPEQYGKINFSEASVKSGEMATFTFSLKAPLELGLFKNIYKIMGPENVVQNEAFSITRIDSQYSAEFVSHTIPLAVLNYWKLPVVVKFKNTGLGSWDGNMVLRLYDLGGSTSVFYDSSWNDYDGNIRFNENKVKPGDTATFRLYLKSPSHIGLYLNKMLLGIPGRNIIVQGGEYTQIIRVDK